MPRTRSTNAAVHPGDAIPKQKRRTKAEMKAAAEAEQLSKKKAAAAKQRKLTKVAQAEAAIIYEKEAYEVLEPRSRPAARKSLKRTYASMDIAQGDTDKEDHPVIASSDVESNESFVPEGSMDPSSDFDVPVAQPRAKTKGKSKKAKGGSIRADIEKLRRDGLPAIDEAQEDEGEMMAVDKEPKTPIPPKVNLRKAWESKNRSTASRKEIEDDSIMPPAKKARKSTMYPPADVNPTPKKTPAKSRALHADDGNTPQAHAPARPRPRPRSTAVPIEFVTPKPKPYKKITFTPSPGSPLTPAVEEPTPVKFGGIPDHQDGSEDEEHLAAKSSPVKAGKRVTSTAIVAIQPSKSLKDTCRAEPVVPKLPQPTVKPLKDVRRAEPVVPKQPQPPVKQKATETEAAKSQSRRIPGVATQEEESSDEEVEIVGVTQRPARMDDSSQRASRTSAPTQPGRALSAAPDHQQSKSKKVTYKCLPPNVDQAKFRDVFIPTVTKYLGRTPDPWGNQALQHIKIYQEAWNVVFPNVPYTFNNYQKDKIIRLISQRLYEWRNKLAAEAVDAVEALEKSDSRFKDLDYRQHWVKTATKAQGVDKANFKFIHADAESDDPQEWSGSFQSDVVSKTLAFHLNYISQAVTVPMLSNLRSVPPGGALALSLVAVERALEVWSDDHIVDARLGTVTLPAFSATTWSTKTAGWIKGFGKLTLDLWGEIIESAEVFASVKGNVIVREKVPAAQPTDSRASYVPRPRRR